MSVTLVCGAPGSGKNYYVDKHKGPDDLVIDLDEIRKQYSTPAIAKAARRALEDSAHAFDGKVWVIRTLAKPDARQSVAARIKATETIVLDTPPEVAKQRLVERDPESDTSMVDDWWSHYGVVESDLIVKPDMGLPFRQEEKMAPKENENQGDNQDNSDKGFPADTPLAEMTVEQREAYWKHQSRKHENTVKSQKDYAELKADAEKYRAAQAPEKKEGEEVGITQASLEAAIQAAIEKDRKATQARIAPQLVAAEFRAAAGNRIDSDKLNPLLEDLDFSKYLKDDGTVDTERVKSRVEILVPAGTKATRTHQGRRESSNGQASIASGRDLYNEVHGIKS